MILMKDQRKTKAQLIEELEALRGRIAELEDEEARRVPTVEQPDEERQQLLSIFDGMDEAVYVSDPETHEVLYANQVLRNAFGDVLGQKCFQALQGLDSPCSFCTNDKIFGEHTGNTHAWLFQNRLNQRWYRCIDRAIRWPDGRMVRYEMAIDVTDRVRAEEALRGSEESFRALAENANDGIFIAVGEGGVHAYANQRASEIIGYTIDELVKMSIEDVAHPDELSRITETYTSRLRGEPVPRQYETVFIGKHGNSVPVELSGAKTVWQGQPAVLVIMRDIARRKRSEQELYRLNRALRMVNECRQVVVHAEEESDLLANICRIIVEEGGYRLAVVGYGEQDEAKTVRPVAQMGDDEGHVEGATVSWADTERGRGPMGTAIRTGKPNITRGIGADPDSAPWRSEAARRGYQSSIALPLIAQGRTLGALNIYADEPDAFDSSEISILEGMQPRHRHSPPGNGASLTSATLRP